MAEVVEPNRILLLTLLSTLLVTSGIAHNTDGGNAEGVDDMAGSNVPKEVTYDGRSLKINGKRALLFSGSFHYPRRTTDVWPDLLRKSKEGGLNTIETYTFWNGHEPVQGQYDFEGRFDLVKFMQLVRQHKMYAVLRVGPFIQAEWNHGGLPYWLREVPNIVFCSDNEPFKYHMKRFVMMIVDKLKQAKLFAPQGGPIILSQIENEYKTIQLAYRERGDSYIRWAAKMALSLDVKVPWIMCKQTDAPDPIINTCNGRHCGDTFTGPNGLEYSEIHRLKDQRRIWHIRLLGSSRKWNYGIAHWCFFCFKYHGGTNYARTAASFLTTRYYDEAPLDEFGLIKEPKWGHLKDVHQAPRLCRRALFSGSHVFQKMGTDNEADVWEQHGTGICAAFLSNNNTKKPQILNFRGRDYDLPPRSITILPDCKTENFDWEMYKEVLPTERGAVNPEPRELFELTKDQTDYAWVASFGHGLHAYINGKYIGTAHGSKVEKDFVFQIPVNFKEGPNHIALLGYLVGLPDSGANMHRRYAGPRSITILGLNTGTLDITLNGWSYQVGLDGEKKKIYTEKGSEKVQWTKADVSEGLTWFRGYFDAPEGDNQLAVEMTGMSKGMVWINGQNIGRFWMSYVSPLKQPTQSGYLIPRSYLQPEKNLIVILEEEKGQLRAFQIDLNPRVELTCPNQKLIVNVEFASFGDPFGSCGNYILGNCTSPVSKQVAEKFCLRKPRCKIPLHNEEFKKNDACPERKKALAVQVKCSSES
ncbi:Beta-galactosidase 14 isoform 2 [Hibiscus syriacus]|uniref:Beta-galactosidase n=1 Tax=Hibiscus syriacus TaxID=106335 RepID=A0A6A3B1L4_HIBSY|nr:Beta-galactosidase 14 isoform 2 [Hibiscus syriacus]